MLCRSFINNLSNFCPSGEENQVVTLFEHSCCAFWTFNKNGECIRIEIFWKDVKNDLGRRFGDL